MNNTKTIEKIREALDNYERLPWAINEEQYEYTKALMFKFIKGLEDELE